MQCLNRRPQNHRAVGIVQEADAKPEASHIHLTVTAVLQGRLQSPFPSHENVGLQLTMRITKTTGVLDKTEKTLYP